MPTLLRLIAFDNTLNFLPTQVENIALFKADDNAHYSEERPRFNTDGNIDALHDAYVPCRAVREFFFRRAKIREICIPTKLNYFLDYQLTAAGKLKKNVFLALFPSVGKKMLVDLEKLLGAIRTPKSSGQVEALIKRTWPREDFSQNPQGLLKRISELEHKNFLVAAACDAFCLSPQEISVYDSSNIVETELDREYPTTIFIEARGLSSEKDTGSQQNNITEILRVAFSQGDTAEEIIRDAACDPALSGNTRKELCLHSYMLEKLRTESCYRELPIDAAERSAKLEVIKRESPTLYQALVVCSKQTMTSQDQASPISETTAQISGELRTFFAETNNLATKMINGIRADRATEVEQIKENLTKLYTPDLKEALFSWFLESDFPMPSEESLPKIDAFLAYCIFYKLDIGDLVKQKLAAMAMRDGENPTFGRSPNDAYSRLQQYLLLGQHDYIASLRQDFLQKLTYYLEELKKGKSGNTYVYNPDQGANALLECLKLVEEKIMPQAVIDAYFFAGFTVESMIPLLPLSNFQNRLLSVFLTEAMPGVPVELRKLISGTFSALFALNLPDKSGMVSAECHAMLACLLSQSIKRQAVERIFTMLYVRFTGQPQERCEKYIKGRIQIYLQGSSEISETFCKEYFNARREESPLSYTPQETRSQRMLANAHPVLKRYLMTAADALSVQIETDVQITALQQTTATLQQEASNRRIFIAALITYEVLTKLTPALAYIIATLVPWEVDNLIGAVAVFGASFAGDIAACFPAVRRNTVAGLRTAGQALANCMARPKKNGTYREVEAPETFRNRL